MPYITAADITWVHLKQFPAPIIDPYVVEANAWLEDVASQRGVDPSAITQAPSLIVKRYLANYIAYRFCEDSIAANNTEVTENDMYVASHKKFFVIAENLEKQLTPELLMGVASNNPTSRSVSTGKLHRTA